MELILPDAEWPPRTSTPIKLKTSCNYSAWGGGGVERRRGAKLLVWLNTEDLESATLI